MSYVYKNLFLDKIQLPSKIKQYREGQEPIKLGSIGIDPLEISRKIEIKAIYGKDKNIESYGQVNKKTNQLYGRNV